MFSGWLNFQERPALSILLLWIAGALVTLFTPSIEVAGGVATISIIIAALLTPYRSKSAIWWVVAGYLSTAAFLTPEETCLYPPEKISFFLPPSSEFRGSVRQSVKGSNGYIYIANLNSPLLPGESIYIDSGEVNTLHTPLHPWKRQNYRYNRGIPLSLSIGGGAHEKVLERRLINSIYRYIDKQLTPLSGLASTYYRPLLLRERYRLNPTVEEIFSEAGIFHIISISGLHVALFMGVIGIFFKLLPRPIALALTALSSWILIPLTGGSPSTYRALIMATLFCFAPLLKKRSEPINTLAAAALIICILNPLELLTIGFQLTFAATGAIILSLRLVKNSRSIAGGLLSLVVVSISVFLALAPILLFHFGRIQPISILFNISIVPLLAVSFQVIIGLILLSPIPESSALLQAVCNLDSLLIEWMQSILIYTDIGTFWSNIGVEAPIIFGLGATLFLASHKRLRKYILVVTPLIYWSLLFTPLFQSEAFTYRRGSRSVSYIPEAQLLQVIEDRPLFTEDEALMLHLKRVHRKTPLTIHIISTGFNTRQLVYEWSRALSGARILYTRLPDPPGTPAFKEIGHRVESETTIVFPNYSYKAILNSSSTAFERVKQKQ